MFVVSTMSISSSVGVRGTTNCSRCVDCSRRVDTTSGLDNASDWQRSDRFWEETRSETSHLATCVPCQDYISMGGHFFNMSRGNKYWMQEANKPKAKCLSPRGKKNYTYG